MLGAQHHGRGRSARRAPRQPSRSRCASPGCAQRPPRQGVSYEGMGRLGAHLRVLLGLAALRARALDDPRDVDQARRVGQLRVGLGLVSLRGVAVQVACRRARALVRVCVSQGGAHSGWAPPRVLLWMWRSKPAHALQRTPLTASARNLKHPHHARCPATCHGHQVGGEDTANALRQMLLVSTLTWRAA